MTNFDATDRGRLAEDEYFRRKDAELLLGASENDRRACEAEALGAHDLDASDLLYAHGLRASTTALVGWLPAVEVARLDGADKGERHGPPRRHQPPPNAVFTRVKFGTGIFLPLTRFCRGWNFPVAQAVFTQ